MEILWSLIFIFPIFQLYYLFKGLNITQIAIISSVFMVIRLVSEIPSGILADKWGRKKTLFLSQIFLIINISIVMFSNNFWWFLVAQIFSGMWIAFYSGSAIAFIYDSLKELKIAEKYEQIHGKVILFSSIAGAIAASVGRILYAINIYFPFIATLIFAILSLIIIGLFTEPRYHKKKEQTFKIHFKGSLKIAFKKKNMSYIIVLSSIIIFITSHIFHYAQIYFKEIGIPIILFGFLFAARNLFGGLGGLLANKIKKKFSYKVMFPGYLIITLLIIFGMAIFKNFIGVMLFVISAILLLSFKVIYRGYLHKKIKSYQRATVDSMVTFMAAILGVILQPILGYLADKTSISFSFLVLSVIFFIYIIYFIVIVLPKKKKLLMNV